MVVQVVEFSSGGLQNWKGFCLRINMHKGNVGVVVSCQKLGIISENKVIEKLMLSKNVNM